MTESIQLHFASRDKVLQSIISQTEIPAISTTQNLFHDLLSCVIEQQIHYRSTKKTFAKLLSQAGLKELEPSNFEVFEEKALSGFKLSMRKHETILAIIEFFQTPQPLWTSLTDEQVRELLSDIKGIGPWTVDMIMMYTLERPDIFPAKDYHLKQIMGKLYGQGGDTLSIRQMKAIAEAWKPYRSYAVKALFAWKERNKKR